LHPGELLKIHLLSVLALAALVPFGTVAVQAASLVPLTSFGGGDGWLAPGENGYTHLTTTNDQRGFGYGNGHLYLVNKGGGNFVRILDPITGAEIGGLDTTGITGGFFQVDSLAVATDGVIYVGNLSLDSANSPFKLYSWATEASAPAVVYTGDAGLPGVRVGDTLDAVGSGSSTQIVAGYGGTPAVAGNNGYAIIDPTASTATAVAFAGTPPNGGDFRLGITFTDSSHVFGTQGSSLYRYTSFSGATGTLIASPTIPDPAGATALRLMSYTVINGHPILAIQSIGDSHVGVYSVADPAAPAWLASGRNVSGTVAANGNGTGAMAWGATTVNPDGSISTNLYGMSTNQGIQAFTFTLSAPPLVAGDYNNNGVVDGADYVIWRDTLTQVAVPAGTGADGSGNGTVGPEDYDFWRARFGNVVGGGAGNGSAAPEPCGLTLSLLAINWVSRDNRPRRPPR
jgi:hypothetical protein